MRTNYIYYVTKDKDQYPKFNAEKYLHKMNAYNIKSAYDLSEDQSNTPLKTLDDMLCKLGAVIGYGSMNDFKFLFWFDNVQKAKTQYFRTRFEKFMREAQALTLDSVLTSAPALDSILNDKCSDLVEMHLNNYGCTIADYTFTLDNFIRSLESGITYYVYEKTIQIHRR